MSLLSQPFCHRIGLCLRLSAFLFFFQLKRAREETKSRNQQRKYEGQIQVICISLMLTSKTDPTKWDTYKDCDTVWLCVHALSYIFAVLKEKALTRVCFASSARIIWMNDKELERQSVVQLEGVVGACQAERTPGPVLEGRKQLRLLDRISQPGAGYCVTNRNCLSLPDCMHFYLMGFIFTCLQWRNARVEVLQFSGHLNNLA